MNLKNMGIKVDEEDRALIVLCSLSISFKNFINSMLYGRDTISLVDVKSALIYKKLRIKLNDKGVDGKDEGLSVNGHL